MTINNTVKNVTADVVIRSLLAAPNTFMNLTKMQATELV